MGARLAGCRVLAFGGTLRIRTGAVRLCRSGSAGLAATHQYTHSALLQQTAKKAINRATTRVRRRRRHRWCVLQRPSQPTKQTNKERNKQPNNSVEPSRGSGAAAASRCLQATRSRHDATCALRVPICDAAAYLEETQKLDVRGVRMRLRHARQQRLLGAGGRNLRELQADTALQRWMRCGCARYARQLWLMHCGTVCDGGARPPHRPRPYRQQRPRGHVARAHACVRA